MTVRGVDHQHVHTGSDQGVHSLVSIGAGTNGGADAQLAIGILTGVREAFGLIKIFHGDHAAQVKRVVNHQYFLDPVLVQQLLHLGEIGALLHRHELVARGHDGRDEFLRVGLKTHIAPGDDTNQILAIEHWHAGYTMGTRQLDQLGDGGILLNRDGVLDHTAFEFLNLAHLLCLVGNRHTLVNDADAALLCHRDGQAKFGHSIHGGRYQGDVQFYVARQLGAQRDAGGDNLGVTRTQQDIVKRKGFLGYPQHNGCTPSDDDEVNRRL